MLTTQASTKVLAIVSGCIFDPYHGWKYTLQLCPNNQSLTILEDWLEKAYQSIEALPMASKA